MKSLSDLQSVLGDLQGSIGGLQDQIDDCVAFIAQITGSGGRKRGPYRKTNGATLRDKVKRHFVATRGGKWGRLNALEFVEPSGNTVTVEQAAKMLRMSDANVRLKIKGGDLRAMKEMRAGKKRTGPGSAPHPVMVLNRNEVLAYADARNGDTPPVRSTRPAPKKRRPTGPKHYSPAQLKQRERSAALLSQFDRTEPKSIRDTRLGALVRRGYLARKGDGYIRTAREFILAPGRSHNGSSTAPTPKRKVTGNWSATAKARRQLTAELLATFDREDPHTLTDRPHRVGVLVQHGYLKAKGDGHVRTAKPFEP